MDQTFRANRWIVFAATLLVTLLNFSILFSLGSLFVAMLDKFRASRSSTALVQSLMIGMSGFAVIAGFLISKLCLWKVSLIGSILASVGFAITFFATSIVHLYICISIIAGTGVTTMYMCGTVAIRRLFGGRAAIAALAVQFSCIGLGAIGYPYLLLGLVAYYGVNGTFLIIGGLLLNNFVAVLLFTETELDIGEHADSKSHTSFQAYSPLFKDKMMTILTVPFIVTLVATAIVTSSTDGYNTVYVDIYIWKTFSEENGIGSVIPYQICSIFIRLFSGIVKQSKYVNSFAILVVCSLLGLTGAIILYVSDSYLVAYIGSGLIGLSAGGVNAGTGFVVADIVPADEFGTAYGMVLSAIAVVSVSTGPLYGAIRDKTGSYEMALIIFGILFIAVASLYLIAHCVLRISTERYARSSTKLIKIDANCTDAVNQCNDDTVRKGDTCQLQSLLQEN